MIEKEKEELDLIEVVVKLLKKEDSLLEII